MPKDVSKIKRQLRAALKTTSIGRDLVEVKSVDQETDEQAGGTGAHALAPAESSYNVD